eukprot:g26658.t1
MSCLPVAGCSSVGRVGSVAWLQGFGGAGASKTAHKEKEKEDDNPFESKRSRRRESRPARDTQYASSNTHDAETLKYIQHELEDATTDEREALLAALKNLRPSEVRITLRRRRLEINRRRGSRSGPFSAKEAIARTEAGTDTRRDERQPTPSGNRVVGHRESYDRDADRRTAGFGVAPWQGDRADSGDRTRGDTGKEREFRDPWDRYDRRIPDRASASSASWNRDSRSPRDERLPPRDPRDDDSRGPRIYAGKPENDDKPRNDIRDRQLDPRASRDLLTQNAPSRTGYDRRFPDDRSPRRGDERKEDRHDNRRDVIARSPRENGGPDLRRDDVMSRDPSGADARRPYSPIASRNGFRVDDRDAVAGNGQAYPSEWNETLQRLIGTTDSIASRGGPGATAEERQEYIRRQVYLRMLYLMSERPQQSIQAIEGIDPVDQKFWQDTFYGLANYLDPQLVRDPAARATRTAAALQKAAEELQQNANLKIERLAFCDDIVNFGNYRTFPTNEFRRGEHVLVYAEIANFKSVPVQNNMFQTLLKSRIELSKVGARSNTVIAEIKPKPTRDLCHSRRRDYFHSYEIEIPRNAGLGPHVLKLIITDEQGHKQIATHSPRQTTMNDGFLGYDTSFMLDFVVCALALVVPALLYSLYLVKYRRNYLWHRNLQLALGIVLLLAVSAFEVDLQLVHGGWENVANKPGETPRLVGEQFDAARRLLWVHLVFAISTPLLWIATIVLALKRFPSPPVPNAHSRLHKRLGWLSAIDITLTSITGLIFYYVAFMATKV